MHEFNESRIISRHLQGADGSTRTHEHQGWRIWHRLFCKLTSISVGTIHRSNVIQDPTARSELGQKFGIHKSHYSSIKNTSGHLVEVTRGLAEGITFNFGYEYIFKISLCEGLVVQESGLLYSVIPKPFPRRTVSVVLVRSIIPSVCNRLYHRCGNFTK